MFEAAWHAARISRNSAGLTLEAAAIPVLIQARVTGDSRGAIAILIGKARLHRIAEYLD